MHAKIIPKIRWSEYVKKHINVQCEEYMKLYGFIPLDNPP